MKFLTHNDLRMMSRKSLLELAKAARKEADSPARIAGLKCCECSKVFDLPTKEEKAHLFSYALTEHLSKVHGYPDKDANISGSACKFGNGELGRPQAVKWKD